MRRLVAVAILTGIFVLAYALFWMPGNIRPTLSDPPTSVSANLPTPTPCVSLGGCYPTFGR